MNNFWQIIYRTGEEGFETKEIIINDEQYKQVQDALKNGEDFIILRGKPTIKRTSIASINEASKIVGDYAQQGLQIPGLPNPVKLLAQASSDTYAERRSRLQGFIKTSHNDFYERMGWEHSEACSCKTQ